MKKSLIVAAVVAATALAAHAQTKKELAQKIVQLQQPEIEVLARSLTERPAAQMLQEAGLALQRQVAPEKREEIAKTIQADVRKYLDEAFPLVRDRALKLAPSTIGAVYEEKFTEDELKQLIGWLQSPVNKKFQQMGPELRNGFVQKLLAEAQPVVDPKVQALDSRIRAALSLPPAPSASTASTSGAAVRPASPPAKAGAK